MRPYQAATAAVFVLIAAVAMFDTRRGALIGATNDPGGIGSGFYPFWSAAVVATAGLIVFIRALVTPQPAQGVFTGREGVFAVLKLVVPMVVVAYAVAWLGLYIATACYMGFFARYIGRFRWLAVAAIAIVIPLLMYLAFERGFRVTLPKSVFYGDVFPV
jgi:putative tricarboxylic transport membrane protein